MKRFILQQKIPVAVNVGKVDCNIVYRWKHLAMCEEEAPLMAFIKQQKHPEDFRVEQYPDVGPAT